MLGLRLGWILGLVACAAIVGAVLLAGWTVAQADGPTPQADEIARYKAAHDTDPHLPLSSEDQALLAQKRNQARAHYSAIMAQSAGPVAMASYWGHYIGGTQQGQSNSYYCGPASVSEALGIKPGISISQASAAYYLRTTSDDGTAWYGVDARVPVQWRTHYPVRDVMNYKLGQWWYIPVALPYSPSSGDVSNYVGDLVYDIDHYYPILGNAWEVHNGPHLAGHPNLQQDILHWFTINGYGSYGNSTDYMDSATTVWSTVEPYNWYFSSATLVTIMGGRGYMW
jgi:hypothetical protein